MLNNLPKQMSNILLSLIMTSNNIIDSNNRNVCDYIDINLHCLFEINDFMIHCRQIPIIYIDHFINWLSYFNNNDYKSNVIMEKLVYIIYYYIQDKGNIINLYKIPKHLDIENTNIIILKSLDVMCIKPIVGNMLKMILEDLDDNIEVCKMTVINVMKNEMKTYPLELITMIVDFMPELYILEMAQMF